MSALPMRPMRSPACAASFSIWPGGKLVPQDPQDEPASELLKRIAKEKARLVKAGEVRRDQPLPMVDQGDFPMNAPIGWALTRLAAISRRIHYGFTASADADLKDLRMLRITDIQDNAVDWSSVPGCVIDADNVDQYKLEKGDILIARTAIPSALLSPPPESAARPPRPHGVLAFAQGLSTHREGHPLFPTVCRQDEMSSLSIGKHVLEIQGQRIDLIVVTAYGESNELVSDVDGPRLIVKNVDPAIDKKMEVFLETLLLCCRGRRAGARISIPLRPASHAIPGQTQHLRSTTSRHDTFEGVAPRREHVYGIEARSEHVHDVVSISVSGNDQEDGIVGCCGLLDGSVDRNEYSGCAGRV
jgi:hypothetical protein